MSKVQDARLPHRVQEWAKSNGTTIVSERDADAIVAWLRGQRGSDYQRKPAEGLRRQVVRVISQLRSALLRGDASAQKGGGSPLPSNGEPGDAAAPSETGAAAPSSDAEWAIDTKPDLYVNISSSKRPLEGASPALQAKAARLAASESNGVHSSGFNLLNASLRANMSNSGSACDLTKMDGETSEGAAGPSSAAEGGEASSGVAAVAADPGASVGRRQTKRERKAERRAQAAGNGQGGDGAPKRNADNVGNNSGSLGYAALGGMDSVLQEVRELVEYPMLHPEIYAHLGVEPPRGLLLHGPPGCGKTLLACSIAAELGVAFLRISAPEVVSGMSGESEAKIRSLFKEAADSAPALIFIDEIDAIAPKRETAQREMERRIAAQLLTCMDELNLASTGGQTVIVMGATNRPDSMDPALRRAGRFDREIALGIPDSDSRERILRVLCKGMRLSGDLDLKALAKQCNGFVGADLAALCKEAAVIAVNRIFGDLFAVNKATTPSTRPANSSRPFSAPPLMDGATEVEGGAAHGTDAAAVGPIAIEEEAGADDSEEMTAADAASAARRLQSKPLGPEQLASLAIVMSDFEAGLAKVQPSARREGFATIPDVSWDDVGALGSLRGELQMAIVEPIRAPERFEALGLSPSCGVLLHGPPGCGKTLLAKAIANESGASFISVKGPELLNKFVGESERAVRALFARGRASSPCVVFFDELDALVPKRGGDSSSQASERVVNQMLTEMDGLDGRRQVFVIAATNRPDMIDPAMLRPGRLDKLVFVPLPTTEARYEILLTATRKMPLHASIDLRAVASDPRCAGFSGADLSSLAREAAVAALQETMTAAPTDGASKPAEPAPPPCLVRAHFERAFELVQPSVSPQDEQRYRRLAEKLRRTRSKPAAANGDGVDGKPTEGGSDGGPEPVLA